MNTHNTYDIVIIGTGISGAAQAYALSRYAHVGRVAVIEKESDAGVVNSHATSNSQTLHEGDIETNYTFEKALQLRHKSSFTRSYLERRGDSSLYEKGPKMVLGIGSSDVHFLRKRFASFKELYPNLEKIGAERLRELEPAIMEGRSDTEEVIALYNPDGITVNYGKLAETLIEDARAAFNESAKAFDTFFGEKVIDIKRHDNGYVIVTDGRTLFTRVLSIAAGAHSMYFAKLLGIKEAKDLSLILVAGNFYYTRKLLTSKVYTVQNPKLPFSAVHGDPDILNGDKTRYGPTTRIVLTLERRRWNTVGEFITTLDPFWRSLAAHMRILFDRDFFWYAVKHNILFSLPIVGKHLFASEIRKIIPTVKDGDVWRAPHQGGVRPQIVNTALKNPLNLGEAKLRGDHVLFNVTPSPGASTGLYNGLVDAREMAAILGVPFDEDHVSRDFGAKL